jgi:Ca-activated chloride channel family protein
VRPGTRDLRLGGAETRKQNPKIAGAAAAALIVAASIAAVFPTAARAAATLATPPAAAPGAAGPAPAPPEPPALAKIVGRLSSATQRSARDWSELGRETVTWGSRLQSEQQPVPEGPVRDALAAVDLGAQLDPKATDWKKLREELEALLKKPEDDQQKQDQNQQDQDNSPQNQDQKNQDQKSDSQKQDKSGKSQSEKNDSSSQQDPSQNPPDQPADEKPPGESAFGDMNKKEEPPPPPPPESTQRVGGAPEKKEGTPEPVDPSLALPLQKLDQLRNQDSPAQLFQLMDGDRKPAKKTGKDW